MDEREKQSTDAYIQIYQRINRRHNKNKCRLHKAADHIVSDCNACCNGFTFVDDTDNKKKLREGGRVGRGGNSSLSSKMYFARIVAYVLSNAIT